MLKVKNRILACIQTGCKCAGCLPSWSCDWRGAVTAAALHHERGSYCRSPAQEEINIQNAKYIFYWMHFAFAPSKYLTLISLGLFVCIYTSDWFCFSGEPWLIQVPTCQLMVTLASRTPKDSSLRVALFFTLLTSVAAEATNGNIMEQQGLWKIRNYKVERRAWREVGWWWQRSGSGRQSAGVEASCNSGTFK